jgi:ABC-type transport system involved in multi-copper enzyme maturation permease subunit
MNFSQVSGIIRYEFLMHWRRRALLGVMLGMAVVPIVLVLLFGESNLAEIRRAWVTSGGVETEVVRQLTTRYVLIDSTMSLYIVLLLMLPVIAADSIPKDRQLGVRELLDSLPQSTGTYLLGKVLGFWAAASVGTAGAMVITGVGLWLLVGAFQIERYLTTWLVLFIGVGLINAGLSIVLAAGQATRRRAIFIGVTFAVLCMIANVGTFGRANTLWAIANPGRQAITSYYFFAAWFNTGLTQLVTEQDVVLALAAGAAELIAVGGAATLWLRRRETGS